MYSIHEGSTSNLYYFTTAFTITYEVEFIELDETTFPELRNPKRFYLLDVHPLSVPWNILPAEDGSIGESLSLLVQQVITQNNIAVVYSYETTDNREKARFRKFNRWFSRYNDGSFLKYDAEIMSPTRHYLLSMIVQHSSDSYKLVQDFLSVTGLLSQRKPRL